MSGLTVGVVIPVFNGARYLGAALESVRRQTRPPDQVVVVDDGSTDASSAVAAACAPGVRCLRQAHAGTASALNRGVDAVRGDTLAFLDADDLWVETKLADQLAALEADPSTDAVFGHALHFHSPDLGRERRARHPIPSGPRPFHCRGTLLIRRRAFDRVGPFDPGSRLEFVEWYLRLQRAAVSIATMERVVLRRRVHDGNLTLRARDARQDYARLLGGWLRARPADRPAAGP